MIEFNLIKWRSFVQLELKAGGKTPWISFLVRTGLPLLLIVLGYFWVISPSPVLAGPRIESVPEMEPFESWDRTKATTARSLRISPALLDHVLGQLREMEKDLLELDLPLMSRWSVREMEGYRLPPGFVSELELTGLAEGRTGEWILDFRGPRLPSNYEIVFRYLHLFVTVHPDTGSIQKVEATIQVYREE